MLYAYDKTGMKIKARPGLTDATCPFCNGDMQPKCGDMKIWHWAHKIAEECDSYKDHETEWHINWKSLFNSEYTEITIEKGDERHRADVKMPYGMVIEFQNSPIPYEEIVQRERFYDFMIWIWNAQAAYAEGRIDIKDNSLMWEYPKKQFRYCRRPIYLDFGDNLFYIENPSEDISFEIGLEWTDNVCIARGISVSKDKLLEELEKPPNNMIIWCDYPHPPKMKRVVRDIHISVCQWHREKQDPACKNCEQWHHPTQDIS